MKADFTEHRFDYSKGREGAGELVVMVGIPGSGKSTLVKSWVNRDNANSLRFNRDDMRAMIYVDVPWTSHHDDLIRVFEMDMARVGLKKGKTVYIDDTNTNSRTRNDWEALAQNTYSKLRIVTMTTPLDVCIERDEKRTDKAKVGEGVIREHHKKLTKFTMAKEPKSQVLTRAVFERDALNTGGWTTRLLNQSWVLVDVDGTLANHEPHRSPYDESMVLLDTVYEVVANWVRNIYPHYNVCIVSGRKDSSGDDTCEWLEQHGIPFDHILMRRSNDNRSDVVIKTEILEELVAVVGKENIAFVIDDRPKVVEQCWKANGITVYPIRGSTIHSVNCAYTRSKDYRECPECGALGDF